MKRILTMLILVVLSFPLASVGGESVDARKTGSTSDGKGKDTLKGTLMVGPSTKTHDGDEDSKATSAVASTSTTVQTSGVNTPGFGTATIDGVMSPVEWDNAIKIDFQANVPSSEGGGTTPATLYIMNDGLNIYFAVKVARPSFGYQTLLTVDFDNNNTGIPVEGDDAVQMYAGNATSPAFIDAYRCTCPGAPAGSAGCIIQDSSPNGCILPAGTSDGSGAAINDGSLTVMEVSHLLNTKDTLHDMSLHQGSKVGYHVTLRLSDLNTVITPPAIGPSPGLPGAPSGGTPVNQIVYAETHIPPASSGTYYGQINIVSNVATRVIDITPGRSVHSINRKSEGKIPVAILSTSDFNAPTQVDRSSLTFGHTGKEESLAFCNEGGEDVNGDGLPDLICHFKTQATGFMADDKFGRLNGWTNDGSAFTATDSVRIVK